MIARAPVATLDRVQAFLAGLRKDAAAGRPSEDARRVLDEKRVQGLTLTDANLDAVAQYLRTVTGLSFAISPKVRAERFADVKINVPLVESASAAEVLDLVTAPYDLRWQVRDGVVWIGTAAEAAAK